ncbi:hypothetical protein JZ751_012364 [Albula glossodonta]|uniref:Uncharacterized protein n=1 Tax=Albula glossodonta TaxID=121402 RepID=A0A8T2PSB9_9TELE|nr:hypothetical protein JZ751_012364 [Albula glossodonta]
MPHMDRKALAHSELLIGHFTPVICQPIAVAGWSCSLQQERLKLQKHGLEKIYLCLGKASKSRRLIDVLLNFALKMDSLRFSSMTPCWRNLAVKPSAGNVKGDMQLSRFADLPLSPLAIPTLVERALLISAGGECTLYRHAASILSQSHLSQSMKTVCRLYQSDQEIKRLLQKCHSGFKCSRLISVYQLIGPSYHGNRL